MLWTRRLIMEAKCDCYHTCTLRTVYMLVVNLYRLGRDAGQFTVDTQLIPSATLKHLRKLVWRDVAVHVHSVAQTKSRRRCGL